MRDDVQTRAHADRVHVHLCMRVCRCMRGVRHSLGVRGIYLARMSTGIYMWCGQRLCTVNACVRSASDSHTSLLSMHLSGRSVQRGDAQHPLSGGWHRCNDRSHSIIWPSRITRRA